MHGIATFEELISSGLSPSTINGRCKRGEFHRLLPSVYSIGAPTTLGRCAAIVAWAPEATISHRSAAWLHGMLPEPSLFEATVPLNFSRRTPKWLKLYRRGLRADLIGDTWGLPTVEPARAVFDCVSVLDSDAAGHLIDHQLRTRIEPAHLLELCELDAGLVGSRAARRQLRLAATNFLSEPERMFSRALAIRNCPLPANRSVGKYWCDFVDERSKTVIEIDGREFHSEPEVFRDDRRRQNWIVLNGRLVLRYAAYDVYNHLDEIADEAVEVIRRRRRNRRPA